MLTSKADNASSPDTALHKATPPLPALLCFDVTSRPFDLVRRIHAASPWWSFAVVGPLLLAVAKVGSLYVEPTSSNLAPAIVGVLAIWAVLGITIYVKYPTSRIEVDEHTLRFDDGSRHFEYELSAAERWTRVGHDRAIWFGANAAVWIPARSSTPESRRALDERLPRSVRRPDRTGVLSHATITLFVPVLLFAAFLVLYDAWTRSLDSSESLRFAPPPLARPVQDWAGR